MSEMTKYEPTDLTQLIKYAQWMMDSELLPDHIKTPQDVVLLVQFGAGFGVPPMQAIQNLYIVEGKVTMGAHIALGLAMSHPACEYMMCTESTTELAVWEGKRAGHPKPTTVSYTIKQAKDARLTNKSNWQKHPAEMLRARAGMHLARLLFPDMLAGVYDPDELGAVTQPQPEPAPRSSATVQIHREPQPAPQIADIEDAEIVEESKPAPAAQTERLPNPGPTSRAAKEISDGEEHDALCDELRDYLKQAGLGKQLNLLVMEGFIQRYGEGEEEMGRIPLKALRVGIEQLRLDIERHGLPTALRDITEWAPNYVDPPVDKPTRHTAA
jgi:hypothetical protein